MKYPLATIVRAAIAGILGAAGAVTTAAQGSDVATLDWAAWLSVLGTGLVTATALLRPTDLSSPNDRAVASVHDVAVAAAKTHEQLTQQAVDSVGRLKDAVGDLLNGVLPASIQLPPVINNVVQADAVWQRPLGPLAQQMITAANDT